MTTDECPHIYFRAHRDGRHYRLLCGQCGAEQFPRGYWGDEIGATTITDSEGRTAREAREEAVWDAPALP